MSFGFFISTALLIAIHCGIIYALGWVLENVEFGQNPKAQHRWEVAVKVVRIILYCMLIYVLFETALILLAPLFEQMNAAFDAAVSNLFGLLDKLIPWAVLGGIGWGFWKKYHPKQAISPAAVTDVDIELERQRAKERYSILLAFVFRIMVSVSQNGDIKRMGDPHDIESKVTNEEHFYMDGIVPIYQFEFPTVDEVTQEKADSIRDELQKAGANYIGDYPSLISPEAAGRTPFEVLTVHPLGKRVCVDIVLTTAASTKLIENTRRARAERQLKQKREQEKVQPIPQDPLFK